MNDRKPRVYVVQETQHNIAVASDYGDIIPVIPKTGQVVIIASQPVVRHVRQVLKDYDGRKDFILPVGDPAAIGITVAVASEFSAGYVQLLRWDRMQQRYYPVVLDLRDRPLGVAGSGGLAANGR